MAVPTSSFMAGEGMICQVHRSAVWSRDLVQCPILPLKVKLMRKGKQHCTATTCTFQMCPPSPRRNALATLASERSEIQTTLAKQRQNCNRLFHSTIVIASASVATEAVTNGGSISIVATTLGVGAAALMAVVNMVQPPSNGAGYFEPLTTGLESTLDLRDSHNCDLEPEASTFTSWNGWSPELEADLKRTASLLHNSDVPQYVDVAKNANNLNRILDTTSPLLETASAVCSFVDSVSEMHISGILAGLTLGALFVRTVSQTVQPGAAFETYKSCARYYADVESSIEKALSLPVNEREEGVLFRQKIALQLGRSASKLTLVPVNETRAGSKF